ncbi:MAG: hypothetical protein M3H12_09500, partial [Chromatiales bacterium]
HDGYAASGLRLLRTTSLRFTLHGWQRKLKIPQRYVFGFYSAVFALGLANTGETMKSLDYIPIAADVEEKQPDSASWFSNWIPFFRSKNG